MKEPIVPVEIGHRACTNFLVSHIAMKMDRKLYRDPLNEQFINDNEANSILSRPQRFPFGTDYISLSKLI